MNIGLKKEITLALICIVLLIFLNYNYLDSELENFLTDTETKNVEVKRVIDGDTLVYETNNSKEMPVRLLGINTPERGEEYYNEAKEFLKNRVLNESVKLVYGEEKTDRYGRELAYIFYKKENVNLEIIKEGLGNYYFPSGKNKHYNSFVNAWKGCLEKEKNMCKYSDEEFAECIELENIDKWEQEVIFYNSCDIDCNLTGWSIKDEGRKKFVFQDIVLEPQEEIFIVAGEKENKEDILYWKEDYIWTASGDTLFLRDKREKLVLWEIIK